MAVHIAAGGPVISHYRGAKVICPVYCEVCESEMVRGPWGYAYCKNCGTMYRTRRGRR